MGLGGSHEAGELGRQWGAGVSGEKGCDYGLRIKGRRWLHYRQGEVLVCYHASSCAFPRVFLLVSCASLLAFNNVQTSMKRKILKCVSCTSVTHEWYFAMTLLRGTLEMQNIHHHCKQRNLWLGWQLWLNDVHWVKQCLRIVFQDTLNINGHFLVLKTKGSCFYFSSAPALVSNWQCWWQNVSTFLISYFQRTRTVRNVRWSSPTSLWFLHWHNCWSYNYIA